MGRLGQRALVSVPWSACQDCGGRLWSPLRRGSGDRDNLNTIRTGLVSTGETCLGSYCTTAARFVGGFG